MEICGLHELRLSSLLGLWRYTVRFTRFKFTCMNECPSQRISVNSSSRTSLMSSHWHLKTRRTMCVLQGFAHLWTLLKKVRHKFLLLYYILLLALTPVLDAFQLKEKITIFLPQFISLLEVKHLRAPVVELLSSLAVNATGLLSPHHNVILPEPCICSCSSRGSFIPYHFSHQHKDRTLWWPVGTPLEAYSERYVDPPCQNLGCLLTYFCREIQLWAGFGPFGAIRYISSLDATPSSQISIQGRKGSAAQLW